MFTLLCILIPVFILLFGAISQTISIFVAVVAGISRLKQDCVIEITASRMGYYKLPTMRYIFAAMVF